MKNWDAIIIGSGIIGLSLARELHKSSLKVLVLERGQPGHEASHAAAGMLADGSEIPPALRELATLSARLYPEFAFEVHDESGINPDLRDFGTIWIPGEQPLDVPSAALTQSQLAEIEPALSMQRHAAYFLEERSVDPRALTEALWKAGKHREIDISTGVEARTILTENGTATGVQANKTEYHAKVIVNCAGAWAGEVLPCPVPVRPVKGHMLSIVGGPKLKHVIRSSEVYLVPRSDGRIVIGSTLEEVGFDKRVDAEIIQRLYRSAIALVPELKNSRIHESWAGLRPATPDDLPILGKTEINGYFVASGHFRDGILLAPVTAQIMSELITDGKTDLDIAAFSPQRYS